MGSWLDLVSLPLDSDSNRLLAGWFTSFGSAPSIAFYLADPGHRQEWNSQVTDAGELRRGPLFLMEKRGKGYDSAHGNWHYAVVGPDGAVHGRDAATQARHALANLVNALVRMTRERSTAWEPRAALGPRRPTGGNAS